MNYQAGRADLLNPATLDQAKQQYGNVQQGLTNQAAFLQALQGQNALQNQSNVFNQLQNVASGQGPNPAQAMLANASGQNVANTAALMAGQRGAGANPALIARQAGQMGAQQGQNLAGQAAALQAQQSLNALNQMGGLSTNQANQLSNATNAYSNAAQNAQNNILGAIAAQNQANVASMGSQNAANAGVAQTTARGQQDLVGNLMGGIGQAVGALFAEGGEVKKYADGGSTDLIPSQGATSGPQSSFGKFLQGFNQSEQMPQQSALSQGSSAMGQLAGKAISAGVNKLITAGLAKGGPVPALVSPGEKYLSPEKVSEVKKGADPMKVGEKIPGKARVGGSKDSYANDTVPATLEEGGIILPRSVTQSKDAPEKARAFVAAILKQKALKK